MSFLFFFFSFFLFLYSCLFFVSTFGNRFSGYTFSVSPSLNFFFFLVYKLHKKKNKKTYWLPALHKLFLYDTHVTDNHTTYLHTRTRTRTPTRAHTHTHPPPSQDCWFRSCCGESCVNQRPVPPPLPSLHSSSSFLLPLSPPSYALSLSFFLFFLHFS